MAEHTGMRRRTGRRIFPGTALALLSLWLFSSCAPQGPRPAAAPVVLEVSPEFPDVDYRQAALRGEAVYRIEPERSLVAIEVRRGGPLARLGHDHVVSSRSVQGYVTLGLRRADLVVALDRLMVDDPGLRKAAGFDTQPSAADIEATRVNMLDRVLQLERHPRLLVQVRQASGAVAGAAMEAAIVLNGVTRRVQLPVQLDVDKESITARGTFSVLQSDFGISPFSILGGAIAVQDRLSVRFELRGKRFAP